VIVLAVIGGIVVGKYVIQGFTALWILLRWGK